MKTSPTVLLYKISKQRCRIAGGKLGFTEDHLKKSQKKATALAGQIEGSLQGFSAKPLKRSNRRRGFQPPLCPRAESNPSPMAAPNASLDTSQARAPSPGSPLTPRVQDSLPQRARLCNPGTFRDRHWGSLQPPKLQWERPSDLEQLVPGHRKVDPPPSMAAPPFPLEEMLKLQSLCKAPKLHFRQRKQVQDALQGLSHPGVAILQHFGVHNNYCLCRVKQANCCLDVADPSGW